MHYIVILFLIFSFLFKKYLVHAQEHPNGVCPTGYTYFTGTKYGCFRYEAALITWSAAQTACRGYSNGWLAALDNADKQSIPVTLYASYTEVWTGLYKTNGCISTCVIQSNMVYDTYPGIPASTSTYTPAISCDQVDNCFRRKK
jgi:hypothetical protein